MHRDAVTAAGAALVRFARTCGLIRGEWIAIDGTKFRAVASIDSTRERLALQRYLDSIEKADEEQQASIDPSAVQIALEELTQHPETDVSPFVKSPSRELAQLKTISAGRAIKLIATISHNDPRASLPRDEGPCPLNQDTHP
jgi:hypothetical protein